jgi:hypothetical protein
MNASFVLQTLQTSADGGSGLMFAGKPPILEGVHIAVVISRFSGTSARPTISSGVSDFSTII